MESGLTRSRSGLCLAVAFALGALLLSCQQAAAPQPAPKTAATEAAPKPGEKAVATATKPAEKPVRGGVLKLAMGSDSDTLDNTFAGGGYTVAWSIYDNLVALDENDQVSKDGLIVDWEPAKDGLSMLVKLRQGVKFHDGTDFDVQAFKFNVERVLDPKTLSPARGYFDPISSVEVVDNHTARLHLKAPSPSLMEGIAERGGLMVSPTAVKKWGQDYGRHPVGTGPFQFVEWANGDHITLKRFDGYWRKDEAGNQLPYLDGVEFIVMPDATTTLANLRIGAIHAMGTGSAAPSDSDLQLLQGNPDFVIRDKRQRIVSGVVLNVTKPPMDNKALRQAVAWAVDPQWIAAAVSSRAEVLRNYLTPPPPDLGI